MQCCVTEHRIELVLEHRIALREDESLRVGDERVFHSVL